MPKYWWFPSVFESKLTIQAGFWPYKQVNLLIECPFGSGPAKNWPYMRVDLTSVDLISGRGRDCTGLVNFVFVNWLHNPNWRNTKNIITKPVTISSKLSSFSLSLSLSLSLLRRISSDFVVPRRSSYALWHTKPGHPIPARRHVIPSHRKAASQAGRHLTSSPSTHIPILDWDIVYLSPGLMTELFLSLERLVECLMVVLKWVSQPRFCRIFYMTVLL